MVKKFCQLNCGRNKGQDDGARLKMLLGKVAINLDVLRLLMKDRIVSNLDGTLVITIKKDKRGDGNTCVIAKQPLQYHEPWHDTLSQL